MPASPLPSDPGNHPKLRGHPRWQLVQRVGASEPLQRSHRLRAFLLFVAERAILDPQRGVTETEIRREVFGHRGDAHPEDSVVRVQASHLRRRLDQYFAVEGRGEPVTISLPRGSYLPVFQTRDVTPEAAPLPPPAPPAGVSRALFGAVVLVLLAACAALYLDGRRARAQANAVTASIGPEVGRLWRQMFGTASVPLVVSDSNLALLQDAAHYQLSLAEYQRRDFKEAEARLPEGHRPWGWRLMNRDYTSIADTSVVRRAATINAVQGRGMEVVLARHANPAQFQSQNLILCGPRRVNPWVELFEPHLNFRSRFVEGERRASFENTAPQGDEAAEYVVKWSEIGYGRVAYLPNQQRSGSVLLISGMDMASTEAGIDLVTSEGRVKELLARLGVRSGARVPHFEVLLRTKPMQGGTWEGTIVAHRILPP